MRKVPFVADRVEDSLVLGTHVPRSRNMASKGLRHIIRGHRNQGFTIIELLMVVTIVVLLATLAVPKVFNAIVQSKQTRVERDLRSIQSALEQHYVDLGYYPIRLGELIKNGYLRDTTDFRSPVSKQWYFYAVDNNQTGAKPKAYALGNPGKPPGDDGKLHRGEALPRGRNPYTFRAWGWYIYDDFGLTLYANNDIDILPDPETPISLADYRFGCRTNSQITCDLWTN